MGWDDHDIQDWDDYDYVNKLGLYEEDEQEDGQGDDPEDDLYLAGYEPNEIEDMDEDERREVLEDVGLDPDDYDELGYTGRVTYSNPYRSPMNTQQPCQPNQAIPCYQTESNIPKYKKNSSVPICVKVLLIILGVLAAIVLICFINELTDGKLFAAIVIIVIVFIVLYIYSL